jgi:phosphoribosylformylglycinamidine cyclo-ligase
MSEGMTYTKAGVDRERRANAKKALKLLNQTHKFSVYGEVLRLPYGYIFPVGDRYLDLAIEGVGTKVLLAQLAEKYDTIGIDGVAMAVNDVIRSGAHPLAVADNIHAQVSNPILVRQWMKGIAEAAIQSGCIVIGGEIGDVAEIIIGIKEGKGFDMVVACIGELHKDHIILGTEVKPEDVVIGLRSSGIHSNGVTLARKVLFKHWGGRFNAYDRLDNMENELIFEILKPTEIYSKPMEYVTESYKVKGAVHITGNAYLKFDRIMRFSKAVGFEFNNFTPQPIFNLLKDIGRITDEEMFKTFNMGWGFALIVEKQDEDDVLDALERIPIKAEVIGHATATKRIVVNHDRKKIVLK